MKISKRNIRRIRRGISDARLKIKAFEVTGAWHWWDTGFENKTTEAAYSRTLLAWSDRQKRAPR